jgi:hypothetical protein
MSGSDKTKMITHSALHRTRLRLRGGGRTRGAAKLRKASGVLAMVDLLSCAFGGALFLFMLTAAPTVQVNTAPDARSGDAFVILEVAASVARPIVLFKQIASSDSFIVDEDSLMDASSERRIRHAKSRPDGGGIWAIGATPWDVNPGAARQILMLRFSKPVKEWCVRMGIATDDSSARARGAGEVGPATMRLSIQKSGDSQPTSGPDYVVEANMRMSDCFNIQF